MRSVLRPTAVRVLAASVSLLSGAVRTAVLSLMRLSAELPTRLRAAVVHAADATVRVTIERADDGYGGKRREANSYARPAAGRLSATIAVGDGDSAGVR